MYMHLIFLWGTTSPLVVESLPTHLPLGPDSVPQVTLMSFANEEESWSREVRLHVIHLATWDLERLSYLEDSRSQYYLLVKLNETETEKKMTFDYFAGHLQPLFHAQRLFDL